MERMVGATGFEPVATQSEPGASRLRYVRPDVVS